VIFEFYSKYTLHNWYYIGLPEVLLVRYAGYAWAFATISLGLIETAELVGSVRDRRAPPYRRAGPHRVPLGIRGWASVIAGAVLLLIPIVHPSTCVAVPVWVGFFCALCSGMFRDVRVRTPMDLAWSVAADRTIIAVLREGELHGDDHHPRTGDQASLRLCRGSPRGCAGHGCVAAAGPPSAGRLTARYRR